MLKRAHLQLLGLRSQHSTASHTACDEHHQPMRACALGTAVAERAESPHSFRRNHVPSLSVLVVN